MTMPIRVALNHKTIYRYDRQVAIFPQIVRLKPASHSRTPITSYSLKVQPTKHFVNWQQDPYGNFLARFVFPEPAKELAIEVDLVAEMTVINPFDFFLEPAAESIPFEYEPWLKEELKPFLAIAPSGPRFVEFFAGVESRRPHPRSISWSRSTSGYKSKSPMPSAWTRASRPARRRSKRRSGSCRDTRLAAGANIPALGARGPVCLRLPDSTRRRRKAVGGAGRTREGFHRSARVGRGVFARRGLDWTRPHVGAVRWRRAHSVGMYARTVRAPRPSPGQWGPAKRPSDSKCQSRGFTKTRA